MKLLRLNEASDMCDRDVREIDRHATERRECRDCMHKDRVELCTETEGSGVVFMKGL